MYSHVHVLVPVHFQMSKTSVFSVITISINLNHLMYH